MPQRLQMMRSSRSSSTRSWTRSSEILQLMTSFWSLETSMRGWGVMRPTGRAFWAFMEWEKKIQMASFCYPNVHSTSWQSLARCSGKRTNTRLGVVHLLCTHRGGGGGVKTPYAFPISVMLKKCVQGGGGGQIWPKNAYIINGRPLPGTPEIKALASAGSGSCAVLRYSGCTFHSRYETRRRLNRSLFHPLETLRIHQSTKTDQRSEHS